jgi:hypothetical protein
VRDCEFVRIRAPLGSSQMAGPAVLFWHNCLGSVVERCFFYECEVGITFGLDSGVGTSKRDPNSEWDHQGGVIRNNVIYKERTSGDVGISVNRARDFAIYNNTVILNRTFSWNIEYRWDNSNGYIGYNLTDGPIMQRNDASAEPEGNITSAEKSWFAGADSADYHLLEDSPAVDAGALVAGIEVDYDNQPRPYGEAPDVGADEYYPPYAPGDVNRDMQVNIFDLLDLLRAITGGAPGEGMDLDANGRVDIFDLLAILKLL